MIGDVSTQFTLRPQFLTTLVDRLPFYSTTEESRMVVNAEVGLSMPNPNTENTVYIDDFEGNRDSYSAPMSRAYWKWPAPPLVNVGALPDTVDADYTELIWYNPFNTVEAGDLNPKLTRNEGAENIVTALDFYIPRAPVVRDHPAMWTGVTTTVEPDGTDFSRMQYLELWINDWRDADVRSTPELKLHVDLGVLSEDQQRAPGVPPNNEFDTEDKNTDNKYDPPTENLALRENGGADGIVNELESEIYDLSTATDLDKHGDDYYRSPVDLSSEDNEIERHNPRNYVGPTLSEGAKGTYEAGNALFTEDLNGNQNLDNGQDANSYVSYILPLGQADSLRQFIIFEAESTTTIEGTPVAANNGWRRYRIPLDIASGSYRQVIRNGSLSTVKHMRVWLEGLQSFQGDAAAPKTAPDARGRQPLIEIAAIDVVGNRWRIAEADPAMNLAHSSIVARNVNNQEDRTVYTPPFEVETQSRGGSTTTQREQSLALEVTNLPIGSAATIFKDQSLAEDYTRYSRLGFYTTQFGFANEDSARYFVRIGYDERNYYEYSRPIRDAFTAPFAPTPWQTVVIDLTQLTDVKLHRATGSLADSVEVPETGERYKVVGSPTFTRTQRLTLGVYSERAIADSSAEARAQQTMAGTVWINDLRALDVDRSKGLANRLTVETKLADLLSFTTNWDRTDQNFVRLGQVRPSDADADRLSFSGQFTPHRLMGASGISMPITFAWAKNQSTPRLRTGTDVFLEGADAENEQSRSVDRSFGVTLTKAGDRNAILKNTIGRTSLNFSFADRTNRSPTSIDSSRTIVAGGAYSLSAGEWLKVPIPIWKSRGQVQKFAPLPQTFTISYNQSKNNTFVYRRGLEDPVGQYALQSDIERKTALYQLAGTWRPLPFGSYNFTATRNANIPNIVPAKILGINFGRMTNFGQRIDMRATVPTGTFFKPALDFATSYGEARTPDLSPNLTLGAFQNGTNAGMTFELPFAKLAQRRAVPAQTVVRPSAFDSTKMDTVRMQPPGPSFGQVLGRTIGRLGTVSVRGSFSRTTSYARFFGVPSVPYRLGIVRNPDTQWDGEEITSIYKGPQATSNAQRTYSGEASTAVALYGRTTARVRGSYTNTNRVYNTQVSNNQTVAFPDLQFDWGSMTHILRAGGVFSSLNAQSRFSKTATTEGPSLSTPQSKVSSTNYQPLISFTGTTRGTAQVLFSIDRQSSKREDFLTRRSMRKEDVTNVRASISRSYQPGQKIPIFGGSGLKSTLTLQVDGSYNTRGGSTEANGVQSSRTDTKGIQLNSSGTYSFSSYVYGTVSLGFTQNKDNQNRTIDNEPIVTRSLRLEGAATIRF